MPVCDEWVLVNNMDLIPEVVAKSIGLVKTMYNDELWKYIKQQYHG
ncbi:hypothetical protein SAMN06265348_1354 [Pedobacter westerhofensis]|uniref:Uncharacterized protein n=1 Tax=Pedobacter westerhofensis TaxID=425512 RepID=A0A521FV39_9SPHI|nr:hypothetical protein SAMN06265348_1354 [Pedobacter westerhofensis]